MAYYSYYIYNLIIKLKAGTLLISFLLIFPPVSNGQNQTDIQLAGEYLSKGDRKKAYELYTELAKDEINIPFIKTIRKKHQST